MGDDGKSTGWWQTLPGIITAIAGMLTALAALVAAVKQAGWFDSRPPSVAAQPSPGATPAAKPRPGTTAPEAGRAPPSSSGADRAPAPVAAAAQAIALPAMRDYKLGPSTSKATFTLLNAEVTRQTAEKDALRIRLRMMNHDRYDHNFWNSSFRLILDSVPMAPAGDLNELVAGESAKEGDVVFEIPHGSAAGKLKITYYEDSTEIPLDLTPPR